MKLSTLRKIKAQLDGLHSQPDFKEVVQSALEKNDDFEVDNVRFISDKAILSVMVEEIFSDEYTLGCFNAKFIADNSDLNYELVEACQNAEAFEAIGKALNDTLTGDEKESFCEDYAYADGYGHHFNHYDGNSEEITINGIFYHVFDNR